MIVWSQSNNGYRAHAFAMDAWPGPGYWERHKALGCGRLLDVCLGLVSLSEKYSAHRCARCLKAANPEGA